MNRNKLIRNTGLILIIILAIFFRFMYLDRIPTAVSGDELPYVITAKSIYLTGHDLAGTWNPLSAFVFRYPQGEQQAELPYFLHLPFSGPFPFSLFLAKLPFALLSVGIVIFLYKISSLLFGKSAGIATGLVAAVNPWLVVMGRTGYESTPATFFYLLGFYFLLVLKNNTILLSVIPFFLAFYSYIGTKLIFIPFVLLAVFLAYVKNKRQYLKQYFIVGTCCLLLVAGFLIVLKTSHAPRSAGTELFFLNSQTVSAKVNEMRKYSIQSPLLPLVINKYTAYIHILSAKFFRIFSPIYLFVDGDQFFLPVQQGFLYILDGVFLILGALYAFTKKRFFLCITFLFIVLGTFPHLLHKTQGDFSGHLALMFPFMIILIGAGIAGVIDEISNRFKTAIICLITILYLFNVINFSTVYFYQYPLLGAGDFHMRLLSRYLNLSRTKNKPIAVYSTKFGDILRKYLFYSNALTRETIPSLRSIYAQNKYSFNGIQFSPDDENIRIVPPDELLIYDIQGSMKIDGTHLRISKPLDGGEIYRIYNDEVCRSFQLQPFPYGISFSDFAVENLQIDQFCNIYINK